MKSKILLIYCMLFLFLGAVILVYQSDSNAGSVVGIDDCVPLKEGDVGELSGLLVLESRKDGQPSFVLDLATSERRELPNLTINSIVGPSYGGLLTYFDYLHESWVITDLSLDLKSSLVKLGSAVPIAWLDERRLLIGADKLEIFDVRRGNAEPLLSDAAFAQIYEKMNWSSRLNWDGYSTYRIVPDMDFRYLAYAANGEPGTLLVLRNQETEEEIARLHWVDTLTTPQWAPDGKSLIASAPPFVFYEANLFTNVGDALPYVGGNELMQVGIDGRVRRLTTLTTGVKAIESAYRWSPDGKHLAFSLKLTSDDGDSYRMAILDIESGEVANFCFPHGVNNIAGFPVWSPDGEKIALTSICDDRVPHVYIVDAGSGNAKSTGLNIQAVGWWGN